MSIPASPQVRSDRKTALTAQPAVPTILTPEGERAIRAELEELHRQLESDFTERLRDARALGDSRENDEYLQIKEEEAVLTSRIHRREQLLASAKVVTTEGDDGGVVAVGSIVEVRGDASGGIRTLRITGAFEPTAPGDVSANSPVGQALLGCSPGSRAIVELPDGRSTELAVLAVSAGDATARRDPA